MGGACFHRLTVIVVSLLWCLNVGSSSSVRSAHLVGVRVSGEWNVVIVDGCGVATFVRRGVDGGVESLWSSLVVAVVAVVEKVGEMTAPEMLSMAWSLRWKSLGSLCALVRVSVLMMTPLLDAIALWRVVCRGKVKV